MSELKHEHECNGNCTSCGDDCNLNGATVTLTLEDDSTVECAILTVYPAGGREYIALLPLDENGENQDGDVYLYRFQEGEDGPALENIIDDDEYEAAADAFDELLDNAEFDEDEIEE